MNDLILKKEAQELIQDNVALNEGDKKDILTMLESQEHSKIKVLEYIIEGKNLITNSRDYNMWLQQLIAWSKHVHGDAPIQTRNINITMDYNEAVKIAYKERMKNVTPEK